MALQVELRRTAGVFTTMAGTADLAGGGRGEAGLARTKILPVGFPPAGKENRERNIQPWQAGTSAMPAAAMDVLS